MTVRTRIAPSPTGDPHVGTAYIALFNLCFARAHGGQFVLRIEDTDRARSTPESEQAILDALRWLGLDWDEGPDSGGDHGPYRQSKRMALYGQYAWQLVEAGKAFVCYRTPEELETLRSERREAGQATALKPSDLRLPDDEIAQRKAADMPYVIRMVVPEEAGSCAVADRLRGTIELDWSMVDAQILLKSDGMPTYHLANVVDDHLMGITHVIRGEEWINSAPKHQLLYEYFGWDMPELCHLPLLRNPDKSKLSKRKNPTSILYYERMGFLPEALLNYLGRMGWSMPDEREKFSLHDMLTHFDIDRVSLGGPIFDVEKLRWLNGVWLREELDETQLADRLQHWALNRENLMKVLPHAQKRMEVLSDFAPLTAFLVSGELPIDDSDFDGLRGEREALVRQLQFALWRLEALRHWDRDTVWQALKALADDLGVKVKDFLAPLFIAISGSSASFSVVDAMELLGPDMSRMRIRHAIAVLGGVSKKAAKRLEKDYGALPSTEI
ncbi:glutamate--tRNA ligase [Pseudohaliea rubra]|uniref:Glutamate--tRNA ligase n=1 Tax=Pseudohaliea rubra DSM 19751 TaxID=1265313 RepID=A0A095VUW0_9GAMM|nr:glutamate--tRNA ligase [Pseudohaliea rubra]KGE05110.1 Glutamyl-tRNA synthetase [Pseudohaliea rubra DSM 19751]